MAAVSLFWNTNMAAVMSCENVIFGDFLSEVSCLKVSLIIQGGIVQRLFPSLIFTWTEVTYNVFEICRNVSYCCPQKYETWIIYSNVCAKVHQNVYKTANKSVSIHAIQILLPSNRQEVSSWFFTHVFENIETSVMWNCISKALRFLQITAWTSKCEHVLPYFQP